MILGLTPDQLAERRLRLHAGDAPAIMEGNYRKVFRRIKFGEDDDLYPSLPWFVRKNMTPEQLEFAAALGNYTEPFNLAVTAQRTGRAINYYSGNALLRRIWDDLSPERPAIEDELFICANHPFMACNLDGTTTTPQGHSSVIDAKHLSKFGEAEVLRYTPYGVWQATCVDTEWWGCAPIAGTKWEPPIFQEVDPIYQAEMIVRAGECWGYVERDEEPPEIEGEPTLPPKPTPKLRSITVPTEEDEVYNALCRQNNWLGVAHYHMRAIIGTDAAVKVNAINRNDMKTLVPPDVGEIKYGRYRFARSKADAITQSVAKLEEDDGPL